MKKLVAVLGFLFVTGVAIGQKYKTEKGTITFFSDGLVEDITAENNSAGSLFNVGTGELVFIVPIVEFRFPKSLMREHFNEKYMETEKYPKSTFQGKLSGYNPTVKDEQKVRAIGKLTMHGVTNSIDVPGIIEFSNGKVAMHSKFRIKLKDFKIKIPTIVWQNIAEEVELKLDFTYKTI